MADLRQVGAVWAACSESASVLQESTLPPCRWTPAAAHLQRGVGVGLLPHYFGKILLLVVDQNISPKLLTEGQLLSAAGGDKDLGTDDFGDLDGR